jgi:preprotein translocase subunit SecE
LEFGLGIRSGTAVKEGNGKFMAKTVAAAGFEGGIGERMKSWPQRIKSFYFDVRMEMKKVTAPSLKEVRATTTVVIITVFLFGLYFWIVDTILSKSIDQLLRYLSHR